MTNAPTRIGLLLAAGRGRRMGRTKQLIAWQTGDGPKALVAAAYDSVCTVCDAMVVVLGHDCDAVASALGDRAFRAVRSDPDAPMFESLRAGLAAAVALDSSASIVLQLADHPEVANATLRTLLEAAHEHPQQAIIPEMDGRGGHPILLPPNIARRALNHQAPGGLRELWRSQPALCHRIAVDDWGVIRDLDTPADLIR